MSDDDDSWMYDDDDEVLQALEAKRRGQLMDIYATEAKIDEDKFMHNVFKLIEQYLRGTRYKYVIIGGRAIMAYINIDHASASEDNLLMQSKDYDLTVVGKQGDVDEMVEEMVRYIKDGLRGEEKKVEFTSNELSSGIFQIGYVFKGQANYIVDLHHERKFDDRVMIGGLYYPNIKWLLEEFERTISEMQEFKALKRATRRDYILKLLNSPELMTSELKDRLTEICNGPNGEANLRDFIGIPIKYTCEELA